MSATMEKKGIVSILRSDSDQTRASSLRRTLSADMSSKKWLAQNGLTSPMKKIASSEEITNLVADSSSSDEGEDENEAKKEVERRGRVDVWSSILAKKSDDQDSSNLPPPYVHPLVMRSKSALSEKSLEICTESLGSETGSDGFSSYAPSETSDAEEDKEEVQPQPQPQPQPESQPLDIEELRVVKYNYPKKMSPRSFPPPLPSLARCDRPSLHVHSHRENGRLVLEAVSIPSQNYFHAQREDGRLVLTFANSPRDSNEPNHEEMVNQEEEVIDQKEGEEVEEIEGIFEPLFDDEKESETEEEEEEEETQEEEEEEEEEEMVRVESEQGVRDIGIVMDQATKLPSGVINVHRSALMIKKLMGLDNRNPTWTNKYNKAVHLVDMEVEEEEQGPNPLPQSLPRPPRVGRLIPSPPAATAGAAASFNTYEYFWRAKPAIPTGLNTPNKNGCNKVIVSNNTPKKAHEEQEMVLLRGNKADYLVPLLRGCMEARRSLLIWEPYCIATS